MKFFTGNKYLFSFWIFLLCNHPFAFSQNVGVNTDGSTPSTLFHTKNTASGQHNYLRIENTQATQQSALQLINSGTSNADWIQYIPGSTTDLRFYRGGDLITFLSGGNVGIGTTSPGNMLHVYGTSLAGIKYQRTDAKDARIQIQDPTKAWGLAVGWATGGDFSIIEEGVSGNRIYIQQGGNVGMGTSSPAASLHVDASGGGIVRVSRLGTGSGILQMEANGTNGTLAATNAMLFSTNSAERLRITSTGNIGIWTSAPNNRLQLSTDNSSQAFQFNTSGYMSANTWGTRMYKSDIGGGIPLKLETQSSSTWYGSADFDHGQDNSHPSLKTYYNTQLATTSGNVGIGTTSPVQKLDVNGNIRIDANKIIQGNSTYKVYQNLVTYNNSSSSAAGAFAITTSQPWNSACMFTVRIEGYFYDATAPFEVTIGAYMYTGNDFYNYGYINTGAKKLTVQLGKNISTGTVAIILGDIAASYSYPKISVTTFKQGHSNITESYADGWTITQVTTLANYTYLVTVPDVTTIPAGSGNYIQNQTSLQSSSNFNISGSGNVQTTYQLQGTNVISGNANDVYGNIRVLQNNSTSSQDGMYINYNSTGTTGAHLRFFANGTTERMRIDASNGFVGIGTSPTGGMLHISSGGSTPLYIQTSSGYTYMGALNSSWSHFYTDRPRYYFNAGGTFDSGNIGSYDEDLSLQTQGTTRISVLNSNGNVGIGSATPGYKLDINGAMNVGGSNWAYGNGIPAFRYNYFGYSSGYPGIQLGGGGANQGLFLQYDPVGNTSGNFSNGREIVIGNNIPILAPVAANNNYRHVLTYGSDNILHFGSQGSYSTYAINIDDAGRVGIGSSTPGYLLDVAGMGKFTTTNVDNVVTLSENSVFLGQRNGEGGGICFNTNYSTAQTWIVHNNLGGLRVLGKDRGTGASNASYNFNTTEFRPGNGYAHSLGTNSGVANDRWQQLYLNVAGGGWQPATASWSTYCDSTLKKDIKPFNDGLDVINKINPVTYRYNGKAGLPTNTENVGILAQEIQKVAPYTIIPTKMRIEPTDTFLTEILGFNFSALNYVIINAIKEQQKMIADLQNQNKLISQENSLLKENFARQEKEIERIKQLLGIEVKKN